MSLQRPTFHESWHRVAPLRPRLRPSVQIHRQHFRGRRWHVVQDPASNQFFRLSDEAYRYLSLLDGRRTVEEAWRTCNERDADDAPTQGEVVQLLGQLYSSNLLHGQTPGDVEAMFRRRQKRIAREVRSYLMNLLFIRIPLVDPDSFLKRWAPVVAWIFSPIGVALWLALVIAAGVMILPRIDALAAGAGGVLAPGNLLLLYAAFAFIKLLHELGHGFACRVLGRKEQAAGEVHTIGVMLLVFLPVPYVDASSSWAFRSKWRRIAVGAAGMFVEIGVAAIAAIVWAVTSEGELVRALAYNIVFVAGVSTLLFNGNPLLRYDGYYILSDLLETPNLHQRSKESIYYFVKRYIWGVKHAKNPIHSRGEAWLLPVYGVASFVYRIFIYAFIIWFVADQLFFLGFLLAVLAIVTWVIVPVGKYLRYIFTNEELERKRPVAMWWTGGVVAGAIVLLGIVPFPNHARAEGVVEPTLLTPVFMQADGFLLDVAPDGRRIDAPGALLMRAENPETRATLETLEARRAGLEARRRLQLEEDLAQAQITGDRIEAVDEQIRRVRQDLEALTIRAPHAGAWLSPEGERAAGVYLKRGARVGMLVDPSTPIVRAVASQRLGPLLVEEGDERVEMRVRNRPEAFVEGRVTRILPAGQEQLPSAALGYAVGGGAEVDPTDPQGTRAAERFFEVRIAPDEASGLLPGQRVAIRFKLPDRPLGVQAINRLRQLLQQRFRI